MSGEEFLLKWNDHHNSFFSILQDLCSSEVLTDVTLACGGQIFEAHKLMLCVCSTYFKSVLTRRPNTHPIVFLKDVRPKHLEQLLQYMYNGEINVLQEDLAPLIEAARCLQIKGLADAPANTDTDTNSNVGNRPPTGALGHKAMAAAPHISRPPPMKKARVGNHLPVAAAAAAAAAAKRKVSVPPRIGVPAQSRLHARTTFNDNEDHETEEDVEDEEDEGVASRGVGGDGRNDHIEIDPTESSGDGLDVDADGGVEADFEMTPELYPDQDEDDDDDEDSKHFLEGGRVDRSGGNALGVVGAAGAKAGLLTGHLSSAAELKEQMKRHECTYCGKRFPTPSKLDRHRLTHTGERPFSCGICLKGFTQLSHLNSHLRNHQKSIPSVLANLSPVDMDQISADDHTSLPETPPDVNV